MSNLNDICMFIPPKEHPTELSFFHFVYETEIKRLKQPFLHGNYYLHVVYKGSAVLKTEGKEYALAPGDLFFTYPYQSYTLDSDNDFTFMYISFNGDGAEALLKEHGVSKENVVFRNLTHIITFWIESIRRIRPSNANTLTESVLLYTFSFIDGENVRFEKIKDKFDSILDYLNLNFTSSDLSIKKIADLFFYTEKYLSHLFIKKTGKRFTEYVTELRIQHAVCLMNEGGLTLDEVAARCGFSDKFYFSKVFKKTIGKTPSAYLSDK